MAKRGIVYVLSAPSGAGKRTVLTRVKQQKHDLEDTISATTRAPRPDEADGEDYFFLTQEKFEQHIAKNDFVEFARVHDNFYGTLREELEKRLATGSDVILELDVQGMRSLKQMSYDMVSVFLMPPSVEELESRLRSRHSDSDEAIALRLRNAEGEIALRGEYDYIVINDVIDEATEDLLAVFRAERCRTDRTVGA